MATKLFEQYFTDRPWGTTFPIEATTRKIAELEHDLAVMEKERDFYFRKEVEANSYRLSLETQLAEEKKLSAAISSDCNTTALERNKLRDTVMWLKEIINESLHATSKTI